MRTKERKTEKNICSACGQGIESNPILFQGYLTHTLEYIECFVCSGCYLTNSNDIMLMVAITRREIEIIDKEIKETKRELNQL